MTTLRKVPSRGERLALPWYITWAMTILFAALLFAPTAVGQMVGGPRQALLIAFGIAVMGSILFRYVWRTGNRSMRVAGFLFLLPMLALVATKIRVGIPPLTYGLDLLAVLLFVAMMWPKNRERTGEPWLFPLLWVYAGLCLLSAIATEHSVVQAIDHWAIMVVVPALFLYVVVQGRMTTDGQWWLVIGIIAAGAVSVVGGLVQFAAGAGWEGLDASAALGLTDYSVGGQSARIMTGGMWGAGTVIARLYVISLPLCVGLLLRHRLSLAFRMAVVAAMTLMIYVVLIGQSRSAIAGLAVGVTITLVLIKTRRWWWRIGAVALAALVFSTAMGDYLARRPFFTSDYGGVRLDSSARIEVVYPIAWAMFRDNPVFGVGLGEWNYVEASEPYGRALRHAHNMFLQFLSDRGAPAAVAFFIFFFGSLWRAFKRFRETTDRNERILWGAITGALVGTTVYLQGGIMYALNRGVWLDLVVWTLLALPFTRLARSGDRGQVACSIGFPQRIAKRPAVSWRPRHGRSTTSIERNET